MVLTIDIGNSNIVLGGFEDDHIFFTSRLATNFKLEADQLAVELAGVFHLYGVNASRIHAVVISSVVPSLTPILRQALAHFTSVAPLHLSLKHAGDVQVDIENPAELGMDILATALAVRHTRALPCAIIDMGTATKLSALDKNGALRGVSIAPGLFVSLDALLNRASLLSGISLSAPTHAIGRNSTESIQSGVVLGTAAMLDGLLQAFESELGSLQSIVATGGAASLVVPHCKANIEFCEHLLLDGLYAAYIAGLKTV